MSIKLPNDMALARLMQLISPSLPIGGYSYSQGIEWAVDAGWISTPDDLYQWLEGLLNTNMLYLELPILQRMIEAWVEPDVDCLRNKNEYLIASRETEELRLEETNRARAFSRLLVSLIPEARQIDPMLWRTQTACYSFACQRWDIEFDSAAYGFLWSWLENLVLSAVKIIPLGQTDGQKTIFKLASIIPNVVKQARDVDDDDIGASSMALAIASAQHETQYTRLFRS
ncbi:MAG: urease accessory protein [Polaribacter sp.]|jgi:urease accessory protein